MPGLGGPDGFDSGGFERGGWVTDTFDDEAMAALDEMYRRADAFLFGRRTFDIFAGSWEFSSTSSAPIPSTWRSTRGPSTWPRARHSIQSGRTPSVLSGDLVTAIHELKARPGENRSPGSGVLVRWLLDRDLVDGVDPVHSPVVVGQGTPLFPRTAPRMTSSSSVRAPPTEGVMVQVYRPAGRAENVAAASSRELGGEAGRHRTELSVDGVMQGPGARSPDRLRMLRSGAMDGPPSITTPGWWLDRTRPADAFLFGRRTYKMFAGSWGAWDGPGDDPIWTALDRKPEYVISGTPSTRPGRMRSSRATSPPPSAR